MSVFLLRHSVSRLCSDDHVLRLVSKRHERPAPTVCIFCGSKGFPHLCHTPNKTRTRGNSTRHTPCVTNRKTRQVTGGTEEDCVWNVMAHAQKRDFVFRRNGKCPFKSAEGASVQSTAGSRSVRISGSNAGYTMFRGSVKSTGYPLHSPVSPSLSLPCVTVRHHISAGLYQVLSTVTFK